MAKSESCHEHPREMTKNASPTAIILTEKDPLDTIVKSTITKMSVIISKLPTELPKRLFSTVKLPNRVTSLFC